MSVADGSQRHASVVARAASGDRDAFAEIVSVHHSSMLRLSYVICGDAELARDAVQNAWQRAWQKLRSLRDESQLRAWLLSVTANETRQLIRQAGRRRQHEAGAPGPVGDRDPSARAQSMDLGEALARLAPVDRELLALRYVLGLTSIEIARQLRISPEGVRTRNRRLLERLRGELTDG